MSLKRMLFVCTGNSCRSVIAKYLMQDLLRNAKITDIRIDSAGVFAHEGMPSTQETQQVLKEVGVDCSGHAARVVTPELVRGADLVLVMEQFHLEEVLRRVPDAKDKVHLLKGYGRNPREPEAHQEVSDPIGKPLEVYEVCCTEIRGEIERVAKLIGVRR